ncbi:MAG: PDZ domain-containing protein [Planctomycetota bacterium]|nr:MAG: PDZ domain-containing protein [Planctomycetota bacterium]
MTPLARRTACLLAALATALAASHAAAEDLGVLEERAMKAALARVAPSVVRIETVGGLERLGKVLVGTGPTTGLVVSADGYIVSSAFNFAQQPDSILVTLDDGERRAARLVATDNSRMLVLLKVDVETELPVPQFVPADEMRVGQWALAVGRTFEAERPNVSVGIVSALGRIWGKAIQTDAKVSPNNYGGPLVDISGRVLGVLVPMSPQGTEEVAGVEWYDSGIGFAIPLETVLRVLPKMKQGQNLHPGLLGIALRSKDLYSEPPVIAAARPTAPAYKAGFRKGDKIVEIAGQAVAQQSQLKHALGPLYAGEKVRIVALRGDERIDREVELTDAIDPYVVPFLGILPMRHLPEGGGVEVRYVYPESPAAEAGIEPGDRLLAFAGEKVEKLEDVIEPMQSLAPGESVAIELRRGDQTLPIKAELSTLPETLPGELPPAYPPDADVAVDERPEVGVIDVKVPEFTGKCLAYVPENYSPAVPHGVVVWLHAPGGVQQDELLALWKPLCEQYDFILLAPVAEDAKRWQPTEARLIRRLLDEVTKNYSVDPARVVAHGHEGGGSMAYVFGLTNRDVVGAIAAVEAPLPRVSRLPETDPLERLAFYTTLATKTEQTAAIEAGIERLRELKHPVVVKQTGEQGRYLTGDELQELVRWFDTLDRI